MSAKTVIQAYAPNKAAVWNETIGRTKTPLFLFDRGYMDYHADRFIDCSALGEIDGQTVALFPASINPVTRQVVSHAGLTFGGPLITQDLRSGEALDMIARWLDWLGAQGVAQATVKIIPPAFARYPADETAYALWRRGFTLARRDFSSILPLAGRLPFNTLKTRAVKKAHRQGLSIKNPSVADFYTLLAAVLAERHQVAPVHSADELALLIQRFPDQITAYGAFDEGTLLGAALVYNYGHVWHTQYLAVSTAGRDRGALDLVIDHLIGQAQMNGITAISFGASSEAAGTILNDGLLWQKESYGARALVHDFMTVEL